MLNILCGVSVNGFEDSNELGLLCRSKIWFLFAERCFHHRMDDELFTDIDSCSWGEKDRFAPVMEFVSST